MYVYEKVKIYLDDNGIKQTVVAKEAGIPFTILSKMLNGTQTMYAEDLRSICYALGISATTFIGQKTA